VKTQEELIELEQMITLNGQYPFRTNEAEMKRLNADPGQVEKLFERLMIERLQRWCEIAEERLKNTTVKMYVTGGNDDVWAVESILRSSRYVIDPEGQVVKIDDDHEMISSSHSNPTPWKCPRDIPEEQLENVLDAMAAKVDNMRNCIFNIHIPPVDSTLDTCVKLDVTSYPPKPIRRKGFSPLISLGSFTSRYGVLP